VLVEIGGGGFNRKEFGGVIVMPLVCVIGL
jgi:hypothetical protein